MICSNCKNAVQDTANFCPSCGSPKSQFLRDGPVAQPAVVPTAPYPQQSPQPVHPRSQPTFVPAPQPVNQPSPTYAPAPQPAVQPVQQAPVYQPQQSEQQQYNAPPQQAPQQYAPTPQPAPQYAPAPQQTPPQYGPAPQQTQHPNYAPVPVNQQPQQQPAYAPAPQYTQPQPQPILAPVPQQAPQQNVAPQPVQQPAPQSQQQYATPPQHQVQNLLMPKLAQAFPLRPSEVVAQVWRAGFSQGEQIAWDQDGGSQANATPGILIATDQRLTFISENGLFSKNYTIFYGAEYFRIAGFTVGGMFGKNLKVTVNEAGGRRDIVFLNVFEVNPSTLKAERIFKASETMAQLDGLIRARLAQLNQPPAP